ncbi:MAG: molybdate ABC transporter substrate-binding protein [Halobacteriota archaeon]
MKKDKVILGLLCATLCLAVITSGFTTTETQSTKLTIFAAASLTGAFNETAQAFKANNSGVDIVFNYAGSNALAAQLKQGATADVFASADQKNMKTVQEAGLMNNSSIKMFALNKVAIIVPVANPANITSLNDLANDGIKLVVANSSVPIGNYTLQMLSKASNNSSYGAGFNTTVLKNVVSEETNVNDVVVKVALGQGDAGVVYVSDVPAAYKDKVRVITVPDSVNVVAQYPIGVLGGSQNAQMAHSWINYVTSPAGQAILLKYGFTIPTASQNATTTATTITAVNTMTSTAKT